MISDNPWDLHNKGSCADRQVSLPAGPGGKEGPNTYGGRSVKVERSTKGDHCHQKFTETTGKGLFYSLFQKILVQ